MNETNPVVKFRCPRCGSKVVRDGQATLDTEIEMDSRHYVYTNNDCGVNRKWPLEAEAELLKLIQEENSKKHLRDR